MGNNVYWKLTTNKKNLEEKTAKQIQIFIKLVLISARCL